MISKKRISILLVWFTCFAVYSQNKDSLIPEFLGLNLNSIESNLQWKILDKATGNLNKDLIADMSIILESKDSIFEKRCTNCKTLKNKPRIILILINDKVIIQNNNFIARGDEGGMLPYLEPELSIKNHLLTIHYQYTRSSQSYTFQFSKEEMIILKAQDASIHSVTGNFESNIIDFKKGLIITKTGNISKEGEKVEKTNLNIKPKPLSCFGEMYQWKVSKNKYL